MKKSLSLILAIAMVFSMFSSAFAADDALTAQQKYDALAAKGIFAGMADGSAGLDQNMNRAQFARVASLILGLEDISATDTSVVTEKPFSDVELGLWYTDEIAAAKEAGVFVGNADGTFNPKGDITIQELAVVAAGLLGLEVVEGAKVEGAADWAAGYIQALINAKVDFPTNYTEAATRADLASLSYQADSVINPVVPVVTSATKVSSVTATNLKEVTVSFDADLNTKSAENLASYTLKDEDGNIVALKSAGLQADKKSVVITVNTSLNNQELYKLSVNSVKGSDATAPTVSASDVEFKPVDGALPVVEKVESLGNKAIKITFSEPVLSTSTVADTFKVNDTVVSGILAGSGSRTLIVELFSALSVGEHTLAINNKIEDYAQYDLIAISQKFTVVEDIAAPTIAEVKDVTLEGATVVFSEDVKDIEATKGSNYYWLNGTTKNTADGAVTKIDGKTFKLSFSGSAKLPAVATDLYVINVVDYTGNVIADGSKIAITPIVDQTRPEVISAIYDDASQVKLTFSKAVDLTTFKPSNVIVKDSKGAVVSKGVTVAEGSTGSSQIVTLNFSGSFDAGTYTIEVSGFKDITTLTNSMLPYTITIGAKDQAAPNVTAVNGTANVYYVTFDKAMDVSTTASILNPDSYYLTSYVQNSTNKAGKLPAGTNIVPVNGNKGVIITLPASVTSVSAITIQGVKSASGIVLAGYVQTPIITNVFQVDYAYATATDSVFLKFNQPVSRYATIAGITVNGAQVSGATVDATDSTLVKLTATNSSTNAGNAVVVPASAFYNLNSAVSNSFTGTVGDSIAPTAVKNSAGKIVASSTTVTDAVYISGQVVTITFDETVLVKNTTKLPENFQAYKADGTALTYGADFVVSNASALATGATTAVLDFSTTSYQGKVDIVFTSTGNVVDAAAVNTSNAAKDDLAVAGFDTRNSGDVVGSIFLPDVFGPTYAKSAVTGLTSVTIRANEALYLGGVVVANDTDLVAEFSTTGTATISTAIYNSTTRAIVITVTGASAGDTISANATLTDSHGNASATSAIVTATTSW